MVLINDAELKEIRKRIPGASIAATRHHHYAVESAAVVSILRELRGLPSKPIYYKGSERRNRQGV